MNNYTEPHTRKVELIGHKVTLVGEDRKRHSFNGFEELVHHINRGPVIQLLNWEKIPSTFLGHIDKQKAKFIGTNAGNL